MTDDMSDIYRRMAMALYGNIPAAYYVSSASELNNFLRQARDAELLHSPAANHHFIQDLDVK